MKTLTKFSALATTSFLTVAGGSTLAADGNFTPTKFEVTYYEIGLTNSSDTTNRFKIFSGEQVVDIANSRQTIMSQGVAPARGTWDTVYVITSNTVKVAGNNGSCYVKAGNSTSSTSHTGVTTTNSASAGDANITWSSFLGSSSSNPNIKTTINGSVTNLTIYTTNSSNPVSPTTVSADRFLFIGTGISVNTTGSPTGTITMGHQIANSFRFRNSCTELGYNGLIYSLGAVEGL